MKRIILCLSIMSSLLAVPTFASDRGVQDLPGGPWGQNARNFLSVMQNRTACQLLHGEVIISIHRTFQGEQETLQVTSANHVFTVEVKHTRGQCGVQMLYPQNNFHLSDAVFAAWQEKVGYYHNHLLRDLHDMYTYFTGIEIRFDAANSQTNVIYTHEGSIFGTSYDNSHLDFK